MYAISWTLLIIGLLSEYFATLLKKLYLKKIARKCSIFLHWLYFFLWEGQGCLFLEKDQISSWEDSKRGVWGQKPKMRWVFCEIPIIKQDTNFISHKLLVRQTSYHHHCNRHAQKVICRGFQVILHCSFWSKTALCIFKEEIWHPNRKCYEKNKLYFDQEEMLIMAWYSTLIGFWTCRLQWNRFWGCTFRCF